MVRVGDRVYHKTARANGVVTQIDSTKRRDTHKVEFFWAKYCKNIPHGTTWNKWMWCEPTNLVVSPWPAHQISIHEGYLNKVTSIGGRSLDRLIRKVCEIRRRKTRDGSDVVVVYGQSNHRIPESVFTINRKLMPDKYQQMKILGEDLAPESWQTRPGEPKMEDWIIKPNISMGGRGIRHDDGNGLRYGEYYQRKFNKVREFRVHCFLWMDKPVQLVQEKYIDNKNQLTWNKKQGGKFRFVYQEGLEDDWMDLQYCEPISLATKQMLGKASIEALKRLKYDFGGLDFGMDSAGNLKIFEVNSRMGLLEQALFTYKRVFSALRTLDINRYKEERWS
jgi:hypothetical protein